MAYYDYGRLRISNSSYNVMEEHWQTGGFPKAARAREKWKHLTSAPNYEENVCILWEKNSLSILDHFNYSDFQLLKGKIFYSTFLLVEM